MADFFVSFIAQKNAHDFYLFIVVYVQPSADRDKRTNHHPLNTHYAALEQNNDN